MSIIRFSTKIRVALWNATARKCFFCSEPLTFRDLDIDHIIPEGTKRARLLALLRRLALPRDFDVNSVRNLVPTHHHCNLRKGGTLYDDVTLRYYLSKWAQKQNRIRDELARHARAADHDRHLIALAKAVEVGELSKDEVHRFLFTILSNRPQSPSDPLVITFGTNVSELLDHNLLPETAATSYANACDWLEKDLLSRIAGSLPVLSYPAEPSGRTGETISVRIAFWNLDLDRLEDFDFPDWQILEIAPYSELYGDGAADLLPKAVIRAHADVVADPSDTVFCVRRCPRCGSRQLARSSTSDPVRDDEYYLIKCDDCGWSDWTQ